MRNIKTIIKYFLAFVIVILFCRIVSYAKTIELNGLDVSIVAEVNKKSSSVGSGVNDEKFSNTEYEKEEKMIEDRYVQIELTINNKNNYEIAIVSIEEIKPAGFRQLESNKNEKITNTKIDCKSEKKFSYNYYYRNSFLKDEDSSILYDENGNIIDNNKEVSVEYKDKSNDISTNKNKSMSNKINDYNNVEEEVSDLKRGATRILLFLLVFVLCVVLLIVFMMFYKTIKGNDNFFSNENSFKYFILLMLLSVSINIVFYKNAIFAKNSYIPQIYEYGKSYEKVIYEPVYFNDGLYRFAYKISFSFDSSYVISDEDYENDTDGDGLVDALEYQYMTDKTNIDTDNDGLSDYLEVMYLDYNPLSNDTYEDGVKDGDRDFDYDKLTNIEEVRRMTDLSNTDTDYDTLSDYDEINVHNTNPLSIDTDEDLLSDPDELKLGLDPNNPRTDGVTLDSERKIEQEYTMTNVPEELRQGDIFISGISGSVSGNIDNEVRITKKNEEVFNTMNSFVQSGFEVELKDDEKIDIELDVSKISDRKSTLIIIKFDNGIIEAIDTICEGNSLKANIGSGTYSVMDSDIVLKDFNIMISDYMY